MHLWPLKYQTKYLLRISTVWKLIISQYNMLSVYITVGRRKILSVVSYWNVYCFVYWWVIISLFLCNTITTWSFSLILQWTCLRLNLLNFLNCLPFLPFLDCPCIISFGGIMDIKMRIRSFQANIDPDQTVLMCRLAWLHSGCKGQSFIDSIKARVDIIWLKNSKVKKLISHKEEL